MQQPPNWQQPNTQYPPQAPYQPYQQPPMMPPGPPPRPPRKKRSPWLVIGLIVGLLVLCGAIESIIPRSSPQVQATPTSMTQATDTPAPADTPTPLDTRTQIQNQVNQIAQGSATFSQHLDSNYFTDKQSVVITELIDDFADNSGGRTEAKSDCFDIEKALWQTTNLHLTEIEIHFTANLVDQYGHPLVNMVALCDLKQATASRFNWDNLNGGTAWDSGDYDQAMFFSPLDSQ